MLPPSDATYYNWKATYAGLTVSELKRLKASEEKNRRLKQTVGEQALDIRALKDLLSKHFYSPRPSAWRFPMPARVLG